MGWGERTPTTPSDYEARIRSIEAERDAARTEIERLREALTALSKAEDEYEAHRFGHQLGGGELPRRDSECAGCMSRLGDLDSAADAARAALSPKEPTDGRTHDDA